MKYAAELINQVVQGVDGIRIGMHVCRGNWSRREEVLLSGDYAALVPAFSSMKIDQLVLEYATPRAGEISVVGAALADKEIGLGVVNPRTSEVESTEEIIARVNTAMAYYHPDQIFLNPDCGFGTFANSPVNNEEVAAEKIKQIVCAANILRDRYN